jgi:histidyl-tRNA synthetase
VAVEYDDLTGILVLKHEWCWNLFFGLDRIYLVVEELNLFPETVATTKALFINYGDFYAMKAIQKSTCWKVELYPDNAKMAKQFQHADAQHSVCSYCWRTRNRIKCVLAQKFTNGDKLV